LRFRHPLIKFVIAWFISFITLAYAVDYFLVNTLTGNVLLGNAGLASIVGLIVIAKHGNKLHFGHVPLVAGLLLLIIGWGYLFGNLDAPAIGKSTWWELKDITAKTFLAVLGFIGLILTLFGTKTLLGNWFFLRPFGKPKF